MIRRGLISIRRSERAGKIRRSGLCVLLDDPGLVKLDVPVFSVLFN